MQAYVNVRVKNVDMGVKAGRILYILYLLGEKKKKGIRKKKGVTVRGTFQIQAHLYHHAKCNVSPFKTGLSVHSSNPPRHHFHQPVTAYSPFFTFFVVVVDLFVFVKCKTYLDCNYMSGIVEPHFFFN